MSAFIDARTIPSNTVLTPDLAIIGGGAAGISLARALVDSNLKVLLLESGGWSRPLYAIDFECRGEVL